MSLNNTAAIVFAIALMLTNRAFAQRQPLALPSPEAGTLSNMPFASTPFDGSETIYIVQGGISKKTNLSNFSFDTAGNYVWTGSWTFNGPMAFGNPSAVRSALGAAASGANSDLTSIGSVIFLAKDFAGCTWDATHDVAPCITAAITAAKAIGHGEVIIPYGEFGQAASIVVDQSAIRLHGMGIGDFSSSGFTYQTGTQLDWIGPCAGGVPMLNVSPAGNYSLKAVDVDGIVWNAANCASYATRISQATNSSFHLAGVNAIQDNNWITTENITAGPGTQDNDFWLWSYSDSATNKTTGILLDGNSSSTSNPSLNRFHTLNAYFNLGDAVVLGFSDNNSFDSVRTFPLVRATSSGNPLVLAAQNYIMPNGQLVAGKNATNGNLFLHNSAKTTWVQGLTSHATVVAAGGNLCTNCGPTSIALTTNDVTSAGSAVLNFPGTAGVIPGEHISCGGTNSGVPNEATINAVAATTLTLRNYVAQGGVSSGVNCTVSFAAMTATATFGAYVITATGANTVNVAAPSGGTSQTGLSTASGTLSAADLLMPWAAGVMTAGDAWTVTLTKPAFDNVILNTDITNNIPLPTIGDGTSGAYSSNKSGILTAYGTSKSALLITAAMSPFPLVPQQAANGNPISVFLVSGGAGGGGGARQATNLGCSGGAGGGAGGYKQVQFDASVIWPSKTITIGVGGVAGAAAIADSTAGGNGGDGGNTSIGTAAVVLGGKGGAGGQLASASGGGGAGGVLGTPTAGAGSTAGTGAIGAGNGGSAGASSDILTQSGGGTGGGGGANGGVGGASGQNLSGPSGGGAGGGINGANTPFGGGPGGYANTGPYSTASAGHVGLTLPGSVGADATFGAGFTGGGAGGGAADLVAAGNGGDGGLGGGGGGGAGCTRNGGTAGVGGAGGGGLAVIIR